MLEDEPRVSFGKQRRNLQPRGGSFSRQLLRRVGNRIKNAVVRCGHDAGKQAETTRMAPLRTAASTERRRNQDPPCRKGDRTPEPVAIPCSRTKLPGQEKTSKQGISRTGSRREGQRDPAGQIRSSKITGWDGKACEKADQTGDRRYEMPPIRLRAAGKRAPDTTAEDLARG